MAELRFADGRQLALGKILCAARNYASHAREMGAEPPTEPVFFLKPATAVIHSGEAMTAEILGNEGLACGPSDLVPGDERVHLRQRRFARRLAFGSQRPFDRGKTALEFAVGLPQHRFGCPPARPRIDGRRAAHGASEGNADHSVAERAG